MLACGVTLSDAAPRADPREAARRVAAAIPRAAAAPERADSNQPEPPRAETEFPPAPWRISPAPFPLSPAAVAELEQLGADLLDFYTAANRLYAQAVRGALPGWVLERLDQGKPERVRELGRLRRTRTALPLVIRPDLLALAEGGFAATELDAVPGGFGALAAMSEVYADLGYDLLGGRDGIPAGMAAALRGLAGGGDPTAAIVVADESEDYRPEMTWIAGALRAQGLEARQVHPRALRLHDETMQMPTPDGWRSVDVVYRFLELHDLPNIPKLDLLVYALKQRRTAVTPPLKTYLEEKLLFWLFHHPALAAFWRAQLAADVLARLRRVLLPTWLLDPSPIPPTAAIDPELRAGARRVRTWADVQGLTQRERRLVLKPSGFSPLAWGARGVTIGHDVSQEAWEAAVSQALDQYATTPHVLQPYVQSRRVPVTWVDAASGAERHMDGRARITPYYLVIDGQARLCGVLVTVVPAAAKVIHGTPEAVLAPAMRSEDAVI